MSAPRIETERLVLRLPEPEDATGLHRAFANPNVARNLDNPPWPYRLADAEAYISEVVKAYVAGEGVQLLISAAGEAIGMVGVRLRGGVPYLSYWLGEPHWGRGYATEASVALLRRYFSTRSEETVHSGALLDNPGSIKVLRRIGFEETGQGLFFSLIRNETIPNIDVMLTRERFWSLHP